MAVDLSDFDMVPSATVPIINPMTGEPLKAGNGVPISMQVAGRDSETFQSRQYELAETRMKRQSEGLEVTPAQLAVDRLETLAACLVGWKGITLEGKSLQHTPENALALLRRLPWLQDQVDAAIVNRSLHLKVNQKAA